MNQSTPASRTSILACFVLGIMALLSSCSFPGLLQKQAAEETMLDSTVGLEFVDLDGKAYSLATNVGNGKLYTHNHFNNIIQYTETLNIYNRHGEIIATVSGTDIRLTTLSAESAILQFNESLFLNRIAMARITLVLSESIPDGLDMLAPHWNVQQPQQGITAVWGKVTDKAFNSSSFILWTGATKEGDSGGGTWAWVDNQFALVGNTITGPDEFSTFMYREDTNIK